MTVPLPPSPDEILTFGFYADLVGIFGAAFALLAWVWAIINMWRAKREKKRLRQRIPVVLMSRDSKRSLELPVHFRREELDRQELMGRIGMIPMKDKGRRFEIRYTHEPDFFEAINRVKESSVLEPLIILCSDKEIDQFDVASSIATITPEKTFITILAFFLHKMFPFKKNPQNDDSRK